jgi:hypothetical protein
VYHNALPALSSNLPTAHATHASSLAQPVAPPRRTAQAAPVPTFTQQPPTRATAHALMVTTCTQTHPRRPHLVLHVWLQIVRHVITRNVTSVYQTSLALFRIPMLRLVAPPRVQITTSQTL